MDSDDPIIDFDAPIEPEDGPPEPRLTGATVLDRDGTRVGSVSDVIFDARTAEPRWMVVSPGMFRREHVVPVRAATPTGEGRFTLPFSKDVVNSSPRVGRDHVLSPRLEEELDQHYARL